MSSALGELADILRGEVEELDRVVERAARGWATAATEADPSLALDAVALNLHAFYTGTFSPRDGNE